MRSNRRHTQQAVNALHDYVNGNAALRTISGDTTTEVILDCNKKDSGFLVSLFEKPILRISKENNKVSEIFIFSGFYYDRDGNPTRTTRERLNGLLDALGDLALLPQNVRVIIDQEYKIVYVNHMENRVALNKDYCDVVGIIPDKDELIFSVLDPSRDDKNVSMVCLVS